MIDDKCLDSCPKCFGKNDCLSCNCTKMCPCFQKQPKEIELDEVAFQALLKKTPEPDKSDTHTIVITQGGSIIGLYNPTAKPLLTDRTIFIRKKPTTVKITVSFTLPIKDKYKALSEMDSVLKYWQGKVLDRKEEEVRE